MLLCISKWKYIKPMIRPVVTCLSETWTLTAKDENNLRIFERQIFRKIFGLVNIDSVWRIRNNMEIDNLIEGADIVRFINPLNPELNPICYLLALLGAHHFFHVSRIRVKLLTLRRLMSYIYGAPILDVSRSHTTTQHSR